MKSRSYTYNRKRSRLAAALTIVGMMLMASACGSDKTVPASAQPQAEGVSVGGKAAENADQSGAAASDTAQTNASRAQMEIDEETRNELTAELLEENELDTSVMEPGRSTRGCTFDLPEGFAESEDMAGMYVTDRYPLDASTIYYTAMEQDKSLQLMTEETFKEQTQESLKQAYEEDITVNIDSFESTKIDGYPAFRILCHYRVGGIQLTQLQYAINADKSYMIIYSQTSDYDRMEEYEASAATIHVQ